MNFDQSATRRWVYTAFVVSLSVVPVSVLAEKSAKEIRLDFKARIERVVSPAGIELPDSVQTGASLSGQVVLGTASTILRDAGNTNKDGYFLTPAPNILTLSGPVAVRMGSGWINATENQLTWQMYPRWCARKDVPACELDGRLTAHATVDGQKSPVARDFQPRSVHLVQTGKFKVDKPVSIKRFTQIFVDASRNEQPAMIIGFASESEMASPGFHDLFGPSRNWIKVIIKLTALELSD